MKSPDTILTHRIKQSRGFLREIIDLAELQSWTFRIKDDGLLFFPPKAVARQGFDAVFARDPGSDSGLAKQMRDRFRKAGMKFPDEQKPERKTNVVQTAAPISAAARGDAFAEIRQKISATVNLLSDIEQLLKKIEGDNTKLKALGEALKSLGGLS